MPDWTPPKTLRRNGNDWHYLRTVYGYHFYDFADRDQVSFTTNELKKLDGTFERELRAFAKRMFDDLLGRTIATDCLCDAYSEELETILNNYKENE